MRSVLITTAVFVVVQAPFTSHAQAPAAGGDGPDYERLAVVYRAQVEQHEARIADLSRQMMALDGRIEQNITNVVHLLTGVRDSVDSGTRVAAVKKNATDALLRSIQFYAAERRKRLSADSTSLGAVPREDLQTEARALDARIDRRVDQIVDIASSLTQFEEWKSYERYRDDSYDDNRETGEFRQQKREVSAAEHQKSLLAKQMDDATEKLKREATLLSNRRDQLPSGSPERVELEQRIADNENRIRDLNEKKMELLSPPAPDTRPVSSRAAFEIDRMVAELTQEVRDDTRQLVQLASQRNTERARVAILRERLKAIEAATASTAP